MLDERCRGPGLMIVMGCMLACSGRYASGEDELGSDADTNTDTDTDTDTEPTGDGDPPPDCVPIEQADGTASGFSQCFSTDAIVRTDARVCTDPFPPSQGSSCSAGYGVCASDDDCTDAAYGICEIKGDFGYCGCEYGCTSDAGCGPGSACMCAPIDRGTRCIAADCRSDADCADGFRCGLSPSDNWFGNASLHCHSAADQCLGDADCASPNPVCRWNGASWSCAGE